MKKLLALLMAVMMILSLAACQPAEEPEPENVPREPITPAPAPALVGNYTLTAEYLPFEAPVINDVSGDPDMDVLVNNVYVSNGDTEVKIYTLDGSALTYVKTVTVDDTGDSISVDGSGKIYADGGVFEATIYDPETGAKGEAVASGDLTASKNADFALTYFTGNEAITAITGGAAAPWTLNGAPNVGKYESISVIEIVGDTVLLAGADAENNVIGAYDINGNQQMLSSGSLAGSLPTAATKTANGYVSSSVNQMTFVNAEGAIIGEVNAKELFGIPDDSVWIYEMTALPEGGFLALAQVYKSGVDGDEIVLFKVSGF
ncbi:MAG: hypothetical protein IJF32_02700 [Oscillospiraceae bacterium]|nr:hypothetical protein [Oscillospiraceae bacterium]